MNPASTTVAEMGQAKPGSFTPRELLIRYLPYLPWIIASALVFFLLAFLRLRYMPYIYSVSATLMVKDPSVIGGGKDKMQDMLFADPNKNINDEIQVIRSRSMSRRVVRALGLEVKYLNKGSVRSSLMKESESPMLLKILNLKDSMAAFSLQVTFLNDKEFLLGENKTRLSYGQPFETLNGRFVLERTNQDILAYNTNDFIIEYANTDARASELQYNMIAGQSGESNNIMNLKYETENPRLGADILNQWMKEYQLAGLDEKKQAAENTLSFINEQLESTNDELGGVEKNLLGIRQRNNIIAPGPQVSQVLSRLSSTDEQIMQLGVQQKIVDNLISYITDTRNPYRQVGTILGIDEPSLANQVIEFNKLQVERETLLKTTTRANPMIVSLETTIEKLRTDIIQNLRNVRQGLSLTSRSLSANRQENLSEISRLPAKENEILDVSRRQKILEQLYSFLLEKKLETSILSASTISNAKIIEYAQPKGPVVSPNRSATYIISLILGLGLPSLLIFLKEYLNDRVRGRADVSSVTQTPIIGEVSHSDETSTLIINRTTRRFIAEQFRIIRTNLKYILPSDDKATLLVTSSTSGEGKSFVSTNIGAAIALMGKKTAILEFDIRKPKILKGLGMGKHPGITNYLIGDANLDELPVPVPGFDNLFVVPCGPIPPNPSEIILGEKMNSLFEGLKKSFDVLVIDTAPIGLVGDAMVLGNHADATLYVIRHNYTFKKQLVMLDELYVNKRLPKLSLVLNDIDQQAGYGGYYGYGGYGYSGYGYGQGSEYFDERRKRQGAGAGFMETLMKPVLKVLNVQKFRKKR